MKNKKLIGLLIVLAFITVLVVLNSTLFTLQSISVNWLTTKCELETLKDYTMVDSIEKGDIGIFVVNGDVFIKELGDHCLISHNKAYKPISLHSSDSIYCSGRVLGVVEE